MSSPEDQSDLLCTFLSQSDVPCPSCGYNLRGLRSGICPECSQALVLRVGLSEPRMRLYIAGMVGLAAGAWAVTVANLVAFVLLIR